jgi:predicted PhzF superfamily epimerase YddE/YHI9
MERLEPGRDRVVFHSASGPLTVSRAGAGYLMDFPSRPPRSVATPAGLVEALGTVPLEVAADGFNYLALVATAQVVRELTPEIAAIARLDCAGVIVTARGDGGYDFVSRYFAPAKGIPEDPVTGGAHCALAPYWAGRLARTEFVAYQASRRGGEIVCRVAGDRVLLQGSCVFYLEGAAEI